MRHEDKEEKRKRRLHANKKVFMRKRRERRDWRKRGQKEVQAERRLVEGMKIRDQQELNAAKRRKEKEDTWEEKNGIRMEEWKIQTGLKFRRTKGERQDRRRGG